MKPLQVLDTDYPFESLISNEEGAVSLNLLINAEGKPYFAQVLQSSGAPRLDQTAAQIARTKWSFRPASAAGSAVVDVVWKLPLEPVESYRLEIPPLGEGTKPPKAITSHAVQADDYPSAAIRDGLEGIVVLRYFVAEQGSVSKTEIVQSSGIRSLDDAAVKMIASRWKFEPAMANGVAVGAWQGVTVTYDVRSPAFDRRRLFCHAQPINQSEHEVILITGEVLPAMTQMNARQLAALRGPPNFVGFGLWTYVDVTGTSTDMAIFTWKGPMRISLPIAQSFKQSSFPRPSGNGCWYHEWMSVRR
jgi:TonB family protein